MTEVRSTQERMLLAIVILVLGFLVLIGGGELLVRGASQLASIAGVSPLVIGLTVVSLGTSSPELAVSIKACVGGQTDLAVGNVIGSNIVNVLLVLGASALIAPLIVSSQLIRFDVPIMIAASALMFIFSVSGKISFFEGLILTSGLVSYIGWSVMQSRRENEAIRTEFESKSRTGPRLTAKGIVSQVLIVLAGLVLLTLGSNMLVSGASTLAEMMGMSELMIGLTVVAIGTSLPELVASMVACWKGEREIAVGNVVGSNLFNILGVIGVSALVAPDGIRVSQAAIQFDMPIMIAVSVACLPIFFTGNKISRMEGGIFLAYYVAYMTYLILAALEPPDKEGKISDHFGLFVIVFMVPVTVVAIGISLGRTLRSRWKRAHP